MAPLIHVCVTRMSIIAPCELCTGHGRLGTVACAPPMNNVPEVVPLFATPLVVFEVPGAAALNVELRRAIEQRMKTQPTTHKSNMGGWQSSWDMDRWGGTAAIKLLAYARNVANKLTTDQDCKVGQGTYAAHFSVTWIVNMWANVNRSGNANEYHSHPGSYWSGTYY